MNMISSYTNFLLVDTTVFNIYTKKLKECTIFFTIGVPSITLDEPLSNILCRKCACRHSIAQVKTSMVIDTIIQISHKLKFLLPCHFMELFIRKLTTEDFKFKTSMAVTVGN